MSTATTYSFADLEQALENAGLPAPAAVIGAAIALAESGGRSNAVGDTTIPGSHSVGPWQLNLPYHPDVTEACAMDLNCAAAATARISNNGTDWSAWTTFVNGSYLRYLPGGSGSSGSGSGSGSGPSGGTTMMGNGGGFGPKLGPFQLPDPFGGVEGALRQVGLIGLGGLLLLGGVLLLAVSTGAFKSVVNVTPEGRVLNAARS